MDSAATEDGLRAKKFGYTASKEKRAVSFEPGLREHFGLLEAGR